MNLLSPNLKKKLSEIPDLSPDEANWDSIITEHSFYKKVEHTILELAPRTICVSSFAEIYMPEVLSVSRVPEIEPMFVEESKIDVQPEFRQKIWMKRIKLFGKEHLFAHSSVSLRLTQERCADHEPEGIKAKFELWYIPHIGGTYFKADENDVDLCINALISIVLSQTGLYENLASGETLIKTKDEKVVLS